MNGKVHDKKYPPKGFFVFLKHIKQGETPWRIRYSEDICRMPDCIFPKEVYMKSGFIHKEISFINGI